MQVCTELTTAQVVHVDGHGRHEPLTGSTIVEAGHADGETHEYVDLSTTMPVAGRQLVHCDAEPVQFAQGATHG